MCNLLSFFLSLLLCVYTHNCTRTPLQHKHQSERQSGGALCCDSFASLADGSDLRITAVRSFLILLVVNLKMFSLMVFWQRPCWEGGDSGQLTSPASCSAQTGPSGGFFFPSKFHTQKDNSALLSPPISTWPSRSGSICISVSERER